ncbi:MAG: GAF domain-containing protein [Anaerolineae bacterium]
MQIQKTSTLNQRDAETIISRLRARLLQAALGVLMLASTALFLTGLANALPSSNNQLVSVTLVASVLSVGLLILVRQGYLVELVSTIVSGFALVIVVIIYSTTQEIITLYLLLSVVALLIAFLSRPLAFWVFNSAYLLIVFSVTAINATSENAVLNAYPSQALLLGFAPIVISLMARYVINTMEETTLEAQRSARLLAASADIGRTVSEMLDLDTLLERVVDIIRDRFAFYHVSVFLVDPELTYARLHASTGEVGERMLAREHQLAINPESVVGRSAQSQEVIIARDSDSEGRAFNELLPYTRSELAVPILDNNGIIGVVDIQSRLADAFSKNEIEALKVIANQLATAIRNARLFEDKERNIEENKRLFLDSEMNLREIQRLNRQLTKQAWDEYLSSNRRIDGVTLAGNTFSNSADWSEEMVSASQRRRAIIDTQADKRKVAVPIELRGEVIGAIEIETSSNQQQDDMADMVRNVSQRLAVSLDNARLFEESNEATAQEQRVNEIVSQYQAVDSVDEMLRVTLQGLAETLGASQASIRLGAIQDDTPDTEQMSTADANGGQADVQ